MLVFEKNNNNSINYFWNYIKVLQKKLHENKKYLNFVLIYILKCHKKFIYLKSN